MYRIFWVAPISWYHKLCDFRPGLLLVSTSRLPYTTEPATRPEFWQAKLEANVAHDRKVSGQLLAIERILLVLWECETREVRCLNALAEAIREPVTEVSPSRSRDAPEAA